MTRLYPLPHPKRIYPVVAAARIYPVAYSESYFVNPGTSKRLLLGEKGYPFGDLDVQPPAGVTISAIDYKLSTAGSYTAVSLGDHPDLLTAARFVSVTPTAFLATRQYDLKVTFSDGVIRVKQVDVPTDVTIERDKTAIASQQIKPFQDATFAEDAQYVASVSYAVAGDATVAKTAIPRKTITSGTHDGSGNSADLVDTTKNFLMLGVRVGDIVENTTDGSSMTVTAISTTTNDNDTLEGTLAGGTQNDFDAGDAYTVKNGESLILLAQNFETSQDAGVYKYTLYVEDSSANELTDFCFVRVAA